jgi:hypothetical protein
VSQIDELPRVDVVLVYQDAPGDVIKALADWVRRGSSLRRPAPARWRDAGRRIRYAVEKGIFVVTSTRTGSGRIAARRRTATGTTDPAAPDPQTFPHLGRGSRPGQGPDPAHARVDRRRRWNRDSGMFTEY